MSLLAPERSARLTTLQMVEDALTYRQQRLSLPCPDCTPDSRCTDHAQDERLIDDYQYTCDKALGYALEGVDRADIDQVMTPDSDESPTVSAFSILTLARLRELAADGPVETVFDGRRVIIELDDQGKIAEYPLPEGTDSPAAV
ncbi:MAG: hypothetical protein ACRDRJ_01625 [Streptosporangiaceae bacterium]